MGTACGFTLEGVGGTTGEVVNRKRCAVKVTHAARGDAHPPRAAAPQGQRSKFPPEAGLGDKGDSRETPRERGRAGGGTARQPELSLRRRAGLDSDTKCKR